MSNLSRALRLLICMISLAMPVIAAEPPSNATGSLKVSGRATPLKYAYARLDADGATRVLIVNKPLSSAVLAAEASVTTSGKGSPFRDLVRKGEAGGVEVLVKTDGVMETVTLFDKGFDGPLPASGDVYWFEPYRMANGWTGGRARTREPQEFFDTKWEFEVSYFAPFGKKSFDIPSAEAIASQRKEVDAREKTRIVLPGGGEEGAMYLAFHKNMEVGNTKALLDQMTPAMKSAVATQMQAPALTNTDLAVWATMHGVPPGKVEIVGGVRDADATRLELRKTMDRRVKFGTAKIVRHEGRWKVDEENW